MSAKLHGELYKLVDVDKKIPRPCPCSVTLDFLDEYYTLNNSQPSIKYGTQNISMNDGIFIHSAAESLISPEDINSGHLIITVSDHILHFPGSTELRNPSINYRTDLIGSTVSLYGTNTIENQELLDAPTIKFKEHSYKLLTPKLHFRGRNSICLPTRATIEVLCISIKSKMLVKSICVFIPKEDLELLQRNYNYSKVLEENKSLLTFVQDGKYTPHPDVLQSSSVDDLNLMPIAANLVNLAIV
jgi:hypothetical protein